ncbi:putative two-component system response regulator, LuxR family protein [Tsukamurella pulmonis]|uniref:DNA-binding response regulator, NarL/FixJ family, contains REC and HTH domains n=2 Tax=Tsukamurella pulmonis TaxID=47312 RepID=A0A1H1HPH5_9ACTN|nr:response regulator transcription factor [Tsukamurella pulmonis]KXO94500.1 two-component system response regulator [Tsukamurella pulmonis]BDD80576.1 putative two-component system response regulator, LuxR family protein [Tsukamurella pulmonis]SDR27350.1 DNA-binding response regulator, NarL/FixJ family, contains REC and HTH domains [Tsukamurella pulmonis]SUP13719.1 Probable transcriptional regulatory protein NarL [Tsukamurella pulmonis]
MGAMDTANVDPAGISVLVVDDHPMWREAVARDLEARGFAVAGTADSVAAAGRIAKAVQPGVVLMDMSLPDGNGAAGTALVLEAAPQAQVLILSASDERDDVVEAVKAGACGYLVKSASAEELVAAVHATAAGQPVFTPGLAGLVLGEFRRMASAPEPAGPGLTARETEVLRLVAKGLSAKQIATRLHLSHRTVENHVQATLRKLQLGNRVELARYALENGLD